MDQAGRRKRGLCHAEHIRRPGCQSAVVVLVAVDPGGVATLIWRPNHHRIARYRHRGSKSIACVGVRGFQISLLAPHSAVAHYAGDDESDRVGLLGGGSRLWPGEALAGRRSTRALGGGRFVAGGEKLPAGQGIQTLAQAARQTRPAKHAAPGSGPSGVNYKFWRAACFNGIPDMLSASAPSGTTRRPSTTAALGCRCPKRPDRTFGRGAFFASTHRREL